MPFWEKLRKSLDLDSTCCAQEIIFRESPLHLVAERRGHKIYERPPPRARFSVLGFLLAGLGCRVAVGSLGLLKVRFCWSREVKESTNAGLRFCRARVGNDCINCSVLHRPYTSVNSPTVIVIVPSYAANRALMYLQ